MTIVKDGLDKLPRTKTFSADDKKVTKADAIRIREERREKDRELVTGIFRYIERPGGALKFRFKKYAGDEYQQYKLVDGEKYKLPRMVARHINKDVYYIKYKKLSEFGGMQGGAPGALSGNDNNRGMSIQEKYHRCEFRSLEFMDDDMDLSPPNITMVTSHN